MTFMSKEHHYKATIIWTGNKGLGTKNYKSYDRNHTISIDNKVDILASSDPAFLGDKSKHNPEDLLVSSLSGCHMLWQFDIFQFVLRRTMKIPPIAWPITVISNRRTTILQLSVT